MAATNLPTGSVLIARYPGSRPVFVARLVGGLVKKPEEVMEILVASDTVGSLRGAAALAGYDHKTVAYWVRKREEAGGELLAVERKRPAMETVFDGKIDELVERPGPGGRGARQVGRDRLSGIGADDAQLGR